MDSVHANNTPFMPMERKTFTPSSSTMYVCSLPHVIQLAEDQPELHLLPPLLHCLHQLFKDVVVQVVWKNHGDCRKILFPPVEGVHGQGLLKEFKVKAEKFEMEDKFLFTYVLASAMIRHAEILLRFYYDTQYHSKR